MNIKKWLIVFIVFVLSGCSFAEYAVPSHLNEQTLTKDKTKRYIVFGADSTVSGNGVAAAVIEYFPKEDKLHFVTLLRGYQRFIYPTQTDTETHYFYCFGGESYFFVKVEVKKNNPAYVFLYRTMWTFHFTPALEVEQVQDKESLEKISKFILVKNTHKAFEWYGKKIQNPEFKEKIKERFFEWQEEQKE